MMTTPINKNPWISCPKPNPQAKVRLFCFAYAGGSATVFRDWASVFPMFEICAIQYPGRGVRMLEDSIDNPQELVQAITEGILPYLNKPFAFFGHSMGAMLAFESARLLRRKHQLQPLHLFVSGKGGPQLPWLSKTYSAMSDEEFTKAVKDLNGTPQEVFENEDLLQLVLPILRADFQLVESYQYQEDDPLSIPLTAFGSYDDDRTTEERLEKWSIHTSGEFNYKLFDGDHFYLNVEPSKTQMLRALGESLQKTISSRAGY